MAAAVANDGSALERETQRRLEGMGWTASRMGGSGDHGADVVASCGPETLVVQCKDLQQPANYAAIKEVHAARTHYGAHVAAVVSRNGFTRQARDSEAKFTIHLLLLHELVPGCVLDRTVQGARIRRERQREEERKRLEEERQRREEERRWALEAWASHDAQMAEYMAARTKIEGALVPPRWFRLLAWTAALAALSAANARDGAPVFGAVLLGAVVGLLHGFVFYEAPLKPEPPSVPRPGP